MNANINLLRATAVVAVFIHHAQHTFGGNFPFLGDYGGQLGPQLFFLISGYLITASWEKYTWTEYTIHRLFRIMPAYLFFFLFFGLTNGVVSLQKIADQPYWFFYNLILIQHWIPNALIFFDSLHVTWTLTVELAWYLVVPVVFLALRSRPLLTVVAACLLSTGWVWLANAGRLTALFPDTAGNPALQYLIISNHFFGQLCFFIMGAVIYMQRQGLAKLNPTVLIYVGLIVLMVRPYYFVLNPIFITGLGLGCLMTGLLNIQPSNSRFIDHLSDISYSVYLSHFPILLACKHMLALNGFNAVVMSTLLTLAVSTAAYRFIEKPGIRLGRRLATPAP
jgi:peptidoglycan/LPS O-acetylase OafA/YrhL